MSKITVQKGYIEDLNWGVIYHKDINVREIEFEHMSDAQSYIEQNMNELSSERYLRILLDGNEFETIVKRGQNIHFKNHITDVIIQKITEYPRFEYEVKVFNTNNQGKNVFEVDKEVTIDYTVINEIVESNRFVFGENWWVMTVGVTMDNNKEINLERIYRVPLHTVNI